jgi:hypothetical protein
MSDGNRRDGGGIFAGFHRDQSPILRTEAPFKRQLAAESGSPTKFLKSLTFRQTWHTLRLTGPLADSITQ